MKSTVGETLRKCRIAAGKSVREMSELLTSNGFKASEKTIYSWENGNSQPNPDALLVMCQAYGVKDVLGTFGSLDNGHYRYSTTLSPMATVPRIMSFGVSAFARSPVR